MLLIWLLACTGEPGVEAVALADTYAFADDSLFPEGVVFDPVERAFFASSLEHGTVTRIDADGTESVVLQPTAGDWLTLGVRQAPTGEIVACALTGVGTPEARSELWAFDPATGERTATVDLGQAAETTNCNDMDFVDGQVLVTDREAGRIYTASLASGAASVWLEHEALEPEIIGMNSVMQASSGTILVGKFAPAELLRIGADNVPTPTTIEGDALSGADGIIWDGDDLLVAGNNQVFRLSSSDDWVTATSVGTSPGMGIAALTLAEGRIYGLQGEVVAFVLGTEPDLPFALHALEF